MSAKIKSVIVGSVHESTQYDAFKHRDDNRLLKEKLVLEKMVELERDGQLSPGLVDLQGYILDGQHRHEACRRLKIPFKFSYSEDEITTQGIARLQSSGSHWKESDFAHSHRKLVDYEVYKQFREAYPEFGHGTALFMLSGRKVRNQDDELAFKEGTWKVKSLKNATAIAETLRQLGRFYEGYNKRGFIYAYLTLMSNKDFSLSRLMRKLPKKCRIIMDFAKTSDYVSVLEEIYNWREPNKVRFL